MRLNAIAAVPGTDRLIAVGEAELPTNPLTVRAVIVEYSTPTVDGSPSASSPAPLP